MIASSQLTVLLADDNEDFAETLAELLAEDGHRVMIAHDGEEAVRLFRGTPADVVLLDVTMPKKNGVAALDEIRGVAPAVPAILITAYESEALSARVRDSGFEVMLKPVDYPTLASRLSEIATP